jgi:hypothetical protein
METESRLRVFLALLVSGLLAGLLLACVRAPAGLEALTSLAALGFDAASVRSLALLALALALILAGPSAGRSNPAPVTPWLFGLTLGVGLYLLVLGPLLAPISRMGLLGRAALLATGSGWALRSALCARPSLAAANTGGQGTLERRELLGLLLLGVAANVAVEGLTRPLRRLGLGLETDDLSIGFALALAALVGALSFGSFVRGTARAGWMLALVAPLSWVSWHWLGRFDDSIALERFIRRIGLSLGSPGSLSWHLGLSGGALILPGLALGAALAGLQNARALGALALGAAVGTLVSALALEAGSQRIELDLPLAGLATHTLLGRAAWIALPGALLALWPRRSRPLAWLPLPSALALASIGLWQPASPHLLTPLRSPVRGQPIAAFESSLGLLTIDQDSSGHRCVTLDGRRLTPGDEQRRGDLWQLSFSLAALDQLDLRPNAPRVLLIGLLTPEREALLNSRPGIDLERTGPWYQAAESLEALLYPVGAPQLGRHVDPAEARAKLARGEYDLVVAPAAYGAPLAPTGPNERASAPARLALARFDLPDSTAGLFWHSGEGPISAQSLGPRLMLASDGLGELCVASLAGAARDWPAQVTTGFPGSFASGNLRDQWPWMQLLVDARERSRRWLANLGQRLAAADEVGQRRELLQALALHINAQAPSAPWEDRVSGTELEQRSYELLGPIALELGQDPFVRQLIEGAAAFAILKRYPDWLANHFGPAATRHAPWPALSEALARADLELLDGVSALGRLDVALAFEPQPFELLLLRVRALSAAERPDEAQAALRDLLAQQHADPSRRRDLALAAADLRLPEAADLLRSALRLFPGDDELGRRLLIVSGIDPESEPADAAVGPPSPSGE